MKDFLSLDQLGPERLAALLTLADRLREDQRRGRLEPVLAGKVLAMVFTKPSLRTRVSFDVAMLQLGGRRSTYRRRRSVWDSARRSPTSRACSRAMWMR